MPSLRADENRYLLDVSPTEFDAARRIPGGRQMGAQACWQFPAQPAVILALDRIFGPRGWTHDGRLEVAVSYARGRVYPPAAYPANVRLEGDLLGVACAVPDKDLVKRIPGYRWSAANVRWYVEAKPLALEILREGFGSQLDLGEGVEAYVSRGAGENHAGPKPGSAATNAAAPAEVPPSGPVNAGVGSVALPAFPDEALKVWLDLTDRVEKLTAAIEHLEQRLGGEMSGTPALPEEPVAPVRPPAVAEPPQPKPVVQEPEADARWKEILALLESEPSAALRQATVWYQAGASPDAAAVAGICALRLNQPEAALEYFAPAFRVGAALSDTALEARAKDSYSLACIGLIQSTCGPEVTCDTRESLRNALLAELLSDKGFTDYVIGSDAARQTLERLVDDPVLQAIDAPLADLCRVAHLLATVRSGSRLAEERLVTVLREPGLSGEAFALAAVLYACFLAAASCFEDLAKVWPDAAEHTAFRAGSEFAAAAVERLPGLPDDLRGPAAHSVLFCLALQPEQVSPGDLATNKQRRALVELVPVHGVANRRHAGFLAVMPLAEKGEAIASWRSSEYLEELAVTPLHRSHRHLFNVCTADPDDKNTEQIADRVFLQGLRLGVSNPREEVIALLDILDKGSYSSRLWRDLATVVEDQSVDGIDRLDAADRRTIFERALWNAIERRKDQDAYEGLDRLLRFLWEDGAREPIRDICSQVLEQTWRKIHLPALMGLLEVLLVEGTPTDSVLKQFESVTFTKDEKAQERQALEELRALGWAYSDYGAAFEAFLEGRGMDPGQEEAGPSFPGKRVVLIGGHDNLRTLAKPIIERWGVQVDWLNPQEAKNGKQAIGLAGGTADLVIVNTAHIGHAASGRVLEKASSAGTPYQLNGGRGLTSLLVAVRTGLGDGKPPLKPGPKKTPQRGR